MKSCHVLAVVTTNHGCKMTYVPGLAHSPAEAIHLCQKQGFFPVLAHNGFVHTVLAAEEIAGISGCPRDGRGAIAVSTITA